MPTDKPLGEFTREEFSELVEEIKNRVSPEEYEALKVAAKIYTQLAQWWKEYEENSLVPAVYSASCDLLSAIRFELEGNEELSSMSFADALDNGKFDELIVKAANQLREKGTRGERAEAQKTEHLLWMLDKLNSVVWNKKGNEIHGVDVASEQDKKQGVKLPVLYSIDFSALDEQGDVSITKSLEPYDRRVYIAAAAYFENGQDRITYQQIYSAMGYKGRAGKSDLDKIHASITKMGAAIISVDNKAESSRYNKVKFTYDGALLPMERITSRVNGQIAESVVHLFREPPLMTFAKAREQLTTVNVNLLSDPLSKTNANLELADYLISRISHMKNGFPNHKMKFETIYEHTGITTKKQKQRALPKIKKLLDYYKGEGFIKEYRLEENGVLVIL